MDLDEWFHIFNPWSGKKNLAQLREALSPEVIDAQDEWGTTALHLAVSQRWLEAVELLVESGADTELRYYRTGSTALYTAALNKDEAAVRALLVGGANPDAMNYHGRSPRDVAANFGMQELFVGIDKRPTGPEPRIQNAEHLEDHYHPKFQIPSRDERESLQVGQAVDLYIYGPKKPTTKVRIRERREAAEVTYVGVLDPPDQETNLPAHTQEVVFGPEHVATVYVPGRPGGGQLKPDR